MTENNRMFVQKKIMEKGEQPVSYEQIFNDTRKAADQVSSSSVGQSELTVIFVGSLFGDHSQDDHDDEEVSEEQKVRT